VLLRLATALVGVAIAGAMTWLVWNAANSNDLVIDAFAVPPDLAARGLSGPVVAAKLLDKIATMQAQTASSRRFRRFGNDVAEGLKLEIPQTGVSLSELDRFLREKLGHVVHIRGEMVRTDKGVALTARVGSDGSATVEGAEADTDAQLEKLAENVYRMTQPFRYGVWLRDHGRVEESIAVYKGLAARGPNGERASFYFGWGLGALEYRSEHAGLALLRHSHALDPDDFYVVTNIAGSEYRLGRVQDSLGDNRAALAVLQAHGSDYSTPEQLAGLEQFQRGRTFMLEGDFLEAADQERTALAEGAAFGRRANSSIRLAEAFTALHEPDTARAALAEDPVAIPESVNPGITSVEALRARLVIALEARDWPEGLTVARALPQLLAQYPGFVDSRVTYFDPLVALVLAHTGQFAAAEARLKPMPADCYPCLRARAQVAALQKQDSRADFWFARATAVASSLPFAESEWGRALLDRGKSDNAIEKFKLSNAEGPHFADPLEGWGEALMAKNQSHFALAKFAEAEKYAPNWGRLHLKWGEALVYAGRKDEAKAQFVRAAQLDLTPSEKAELARMMRG